MCFYSYEGISDDVLDKIHTTSTGETYTLRHNESLKVEMQYIGKGNLNANSQGWERNNMKYFNLLFKRHPEMFSKKNIMRIKQGHAPIVDEKMIAHNPKWAQYRLQPLVHHHIGGDGEAVAVPKNAHKGHGEIHNHEKTAGITDNCKIFSKNCGNQLDSIGKTTSQLHSLFDVNKNSLSAKKSKVQTNNIAKTTNDYNDPSIISDLRVTAVRDIMYLNNDNSSTSERGDVVRTVISLGNTKVFGNRSESVKSLLSSGNAHEQGYGTSKNCSHSLSTSSYESNQLSNCSSLSE